MCHFVLPCFSWFEVCQLVMPCSTREAVESRHLVRAQLSGPAALAFPWPREWGQRQMQSCCREAVSPTAIKQMLLFPFSALMSCPAGTDSMLQHRSGSTATRELGRRQLKASWLEVETLHPASARAGWKRKAAGAGSTMRAWVASTPALGVGRGRSAVPS